MRKILLYGESANEYAGNYLSDSDGERDIFPEEV